MQPFKEFLSREKNDIGKQCECYASAVLDHFLTGNLNVMYTCRLHILKQFKKIENNYLDCQNNVAFIFTKLMNKYLSTNEIVKCDLCSNNKITSRTVIPVPNLKIVLIDNFSTLEQGLNNYFQNRLVSCPDCQEGNGHLPYELGPYLYIDVEDAYKNSTYAQKLGIDAGNFRTRLDCIPLKLKIKNTTYMLGGAIEYISGSIGHYIAYCCSITGLWIKRNDLLKRKESIKSRVLPHLKLASISYIRYEN